jgi:hypothetical protein
MEERTTYRRRHEQYHGPFAHSDEEIRRKAVQLLDRMHMETKIEARRGE